MAAVDREGVALARQLLVAGDIEAGRLLRHDDILIPLGSALYFWACPQTVLVGFALALSGQYTYT